jgi:hypothetical protein
MSKLRIRALFELSYGGNFKIDVNVFLLIRMSVVLFHLFNSMMNKRGLHMSQQSVYFEYNKMRMVMYIFFHSMLGLCIMYKRNEKKGIKTYLVLVCIFPGTSTLSSTLMASRRLQLL